MHYPFYIPSSFLCVPKLEISECVPKTDVLEPALDASTCQMVEQ